MVVVKNADSVGLDHSDVTIPNILQEAPIGPIEFGLELEVNGEGPNVDRQDQSDHNHSRYEHAEQSRV